MGGQQIERRTGLKDRRIGNAPVGAEAIAEEAAAPGFEAASDLFEGIITGKIKATPNEAALAKLNFINLLAQAHGRK